MIIKFDVMPLMPMKCLVHGIMEFIGCSCIFYISLVLCLFAYDRNFFSYDTSVRITISIAVNYVLYPSKIQ